MKLGGLGAQLGHRISARFAAASGWRRRGIAFAAGALGCAALPPFHAVPLVVVSYVILVWLLDGACGPGAKTRNGVAATAETRTARAFGIGWFFGFGQFLFGLYWISIALLVDAQSFGWAVPLAAVVLPAALAFFPALGIAAAGLFWPAGVGRIFVLAIAWTLAEWARGHAFTGFPWNLIGYVWVESDPLRQSAALMGIYGVGLLTVFGAAAPAVLGGGGFRHRRPWMLVMTGIVLLSALWGWGYQRIGERPVDGVPGVRLRVVQPNIEQHLKWRTDKREQNFERHLTLSAGPGAKGVTHVIWPEAAVPYYLDNDPVRRAMIANRLSDGQILLTGSLRTGTGPTTASKHWNGFLAIDGQGKVVSSYNKSHLVPFGEYLPFRPLLSYIGLETITRGLGDYSAGIGRRTLHVPGAPPFSPLICYEVIFPGDVADSHPRPSWLLNVTNDAWYGNSTGPYQHLAMARIRAVEEGLPVVRSANTGMSAIIDPYGRLVASLGLGVGGVIDGPLPLAVQSITPYAHWGDWILGALLLTFSLATRVFRRDN